jgi:hypothetical protein
MRYEGHVVLAVLVALAVGSLLQPTIVVGKPFKRVFALTFGLAALGGVCALVNEWRYPFSQSRAAARILAASARPDTPIVGFEYYKMAPVAAYLGRALYAPEHHAFINYGLWSSRWHKRGYLSSSPQVARDGVCWAAREASPRLESILVSSAELRLESDLSRELRLIAALPATSSERYSLYAVPPLSAATPALSALCAGVR